MEARLKAKYIDRLITTKDCGGSVFILPSGSIGWKELESEVRHIAKMKNIPLSRIHLEEDRDEPVRLKVVYTVKETLEEARQRVEKEELRRNTEYQIYLQLKAKYEGQD